MYIDILKDNIHNYDDNLIISNSDEFEHVIYELKNITLIFMEPLKQNMKKKLEYLYDDYFLLETKLKKQKITKKIKKMSNF